MDSQGPSRLTQAARAVAVVIGLAAFLAVIVLAALTNPATVTLDLMFSITGFCGGFLYASYLYDPRVKRAAAGRRGPRGPQGVQGREGRAGR